MKKLLLAFLLCLFTIPALAQNPTCPTRPVGDHTNACASTAFVIDNNASAPFYPLSNPSSGNWQGSGGPASPHQLIWSDTNAQFNADVIQFFSVDPSALGIYTYSGSCTAGDVVTITWAYGATPQPTISFTVPTTVGGNTCYALLNNATINAIIANPVLFDNTLITCPTAYVPPCYKGGYANNHFIGYIVPISAATWANDFNASYPNVTVGNVPMEMKYTVTGVGTEVLTFAAGWYAGYQFAGGTSTGSANAQLVPATGFVSQLGASVTFTPGFTNTGATQLNIQGTGLTTVQKRAPGGLNGYVALVAGDITAGVTAIVVLDASTNTYTLGVNSSWTFGGSTPGTFYIQPNALDNNPAIVTGRAPPNTGGPAAPAKGSAIYVQYVTAAQTSTPFTRTVNYGFLAFLLGDPAQNGTPTPSPSGEWVLAAGPFTWEISGGITAGIGCAGVLDPISNGCYVDKGQGTVNASSLWLAGTADGNGVQLSASVKDLGITADHLNLTGIYQQNGTNGVSCSGSPTSSFVSTFGIVTHC